MPELMTYRVGNIFDVPIGKSVVIAHIVNNAGAFGAGFAKALAEEFPDVRRHYLANFSFCRLGDVLLRDVEISQRDIVVANLFAQDGLRSATNPHPIKYSKLFEALSELAEIITEYPVSQYEVWMPRIGSGLAGGDWVLIENIVRDTLERAGITVVVFDEPKGK